MSWVIVLKYDRRHIEDIKKMFKRGSRNKEMAFIAGVVFLIYCYFGMKGLSQLRWFYGNKVKRCGNGILIISFLNLFPLCLIAQKSQREIIIDNINK